MIARAAALAENCKGKPVERKDVPALVVFAGATSIKWLRLLRPGFQHCFIAIFLQNCWIICDPLSHRTDLMIVPGQNANDLASWYRQHGLTVVECHVRRPPPRPAPVRPFTCVEAVKRILGLHAPWVLTPWQLYRHLTCADKIGTSS